MKLTDRTEKTGSFSADDLFHVVSAGASWKAKTGVYFKNGMNAGADGVGLGGDLIKDTTIVNNGYNLTFEQSFSQQFQVHYSGNLYVKNSVGGTTVRYNPLGYSGAASVQISALGSSLIPEATFHLRGMGNDGATYNTWIENAAASGIPLFAINDNGNSFFNGSLAINKGLSPAAATLDVNGGINAYYSDGFSGADSGGTVQYRLYDAAPNVILNRKSGRNFRISLEGVTQAEVDSSGVFSVIGLSGIGVRLPALLSTGSFDVMTGTGFLKLTGSVVSFDTNTYVTTTATPGYVPYMTGANVTGNSPIYSNGTNVSIGSTTLTSLFNVGTAAQFKIASNGDITSTGAIQTSSTLNVTGMATFGSNMTVGNPLSNSQIAINGAAGNTKTLFLQSGGVNRWGVQSSASSETGSNAGSNFSISAYSDAGALLFSPINISRAIGWVVVNTTFGVGKVPDTGALVDVNGATKTLYTSGFYLTNGVIERARMYETGSNIIINRASPTGFKIQQNNTDQVEITTAGNFTFIHTTSLRTINYTNGNEWVMNGQSAAAGEVSNTVNNSTTTGYSKFRVTNNLSGLSVALVAYNTAYASSLGAKALADVGALEYSKEGIVVFPFDKNLSVYTNTGSLLTKWTATTVDFYSDTFSHTHSVSGAGKISVIRTHRTNAGALAISFIYSDYIFTGSTTTWTMGSLVNGLNSRTHMVNAGSGNITLNSNGGANDFWNGGAATNTITILPGESYWITGDGTIFIFEQQ